MSMEDFIITVYCLIDDLLKKQLGNDKLRNVALIQLYLTYWQS